MIIVPAKGSEYEKVMGLDSGADDYVKKPVGMMELVSRIKAVLRRTQKDTQDPQDVIVLGDNVLFTKKHEVTADGEVVTLTLKEYELLKRRMKNPNIVMTRDCLLEDIWGYDFDGETRTVDVHVRTLRQKLGKSGEKIETVRGVGYRMSEKQGTGRGREQRSRGEYAPSPKRGASPLKRLPRPQSEAQARLERYAYET